MKMSHTITFPLDDSSNMVLGAIRRNKQISSEKCDMTTSKVAEMQIVYKNTKVKTKQGKITEEKMYLYQDFQNTRLCLL